MLYTLYNVQGRYLGLGTLPGNTRIRPVRAQSHRKLRHRLYYYYYYYAAIASPDILSLRRAGRITSVSITPRALRAMQLFQWREKRPTIHHRSATGGRGRGKIKIKNKIKKIGFGLHGYTKRSIRFEIAYKLGDYKFYPIKLHIPIDRGRSRVLECR